MMHIRRRTAFYAFYAVFILLYSGCISITGIPKQSTAALEKYENVLLDCRIVPGFTQVSVDYVNQADAAEQIKRITDILLNAKQTNTGTHTLILDISVSQRSFLRDIQPRNSIYITAELKTEDGKTLVYQTINTEGKDSVISSVSQYKYAQKILQNIARIQKKAAAKTAAEKKKYEKRKT